MQKDIYQLSVLLLILLLNSEILSCNIKVCLTWMANTNRIEFRCRVEDLIFNVKFFNQFNDELADCSFPYRKLNKTKCVSYFDNSTIEQDLKTNTTTLTVKGQIDNEINGVWSCQHGTNISEAIVNVTAWIGGENKSGRKCWQDFSAWTYIGIMSSTLILFVFKMTCHILSQKDKKDDKGFCCSYKIYILGFVCFFILFLPLILGSVLNGYDCINQKAFLVCGFFTMPPVWLALGTRFNINKREVRRNSTL